MTTKKKKIVVIGSSNTDMVIRSERLPRPGETVLGGSFMMNPGGKGAPMIAAPWGVFVWHEFRGASKAVDWLLAAMFALFVAGLTLIVVAGQ